MLKFLKKIISYKHRFPQKRILVIEGGGMRGVFLTGVLQAFTDRNYFPWKMIVGTSAGALTGTAYAAGQIHLARDAFFSSLLSPEFISMLNIINPEKHILNLDWMINTIINGEEPLDLKKLKKACPVLITATHCEPNTSPVTIYLNSQNDDVPLALKATSAIPFFYRDFVNYKQYALLDGALLDPIPYQKALEMGFSEKEILVILTRPQGYRKKGQSFWAKKLYEAYYKDQQYERLLQTLENQYLHYNNLLDELEKKYSNISVIYPPNDFRVSRLTKNIEKIVEGFNQGVAAAKSFMRQQETNY